MFKFLEKRSITASSDDALVEKKQELQQIQDKQIDKLDQPWGDPIAQYFLANVQAQERCIAIIEAILGMWARAGASIMPENAGPYANALNPKFFAQLFATLIKNGEAVYLIGMSEERIVFLPSYTFDVMGRSPEEESWRYRVNLQAPDYTRTRVVPSNGILHFRYRTDLQRPWKGISPLKESAATRKAMELTERQINWTMRSSVGTAIIMPLMDQAENSEPGGQEDVTNRLTQLRGGVATVEGNTGAMDDPTYFKHPLFHKLQGGTG